MIKCKTNNIFDDVEGVNVALLRDFSKKVDKNKLYEYLLRNRC